MPPPPGTGKKRGRTLEASSYPPPLPRTLLSREKLAELLPVHIFETQYQSTGKKNAESDEVATQEYLLQDLSNLVAKETFESDDLASCEYLLQGVGYFDPKILEGDEDGDASHGMEEEKQDEEQETARGLEEALDEEEQEVAKDMEEALDEETEKVNEKEVAKDCTKGKGPLSNHFSIDELGSSSDDDESVY
jgi:hypothetical protein